MGRLRPPPAGGGGRLHRSSAAAARPPPPRAAACLPASSERPPSGAQAAAASFSGGGRRGRCIARAAAAVRPTLKRDTSTVLDAAHVHRSVGLKLGVHTGIAITYAPAPREKGGRRSVACGHARDFAQLLYPRFLFVCDTSRFGGNCVTPPDPTLPPYPSPLPAGNGGSAIPTSVRSRRGVAAHRCTDRCTQASCAGHPRAAAGL